MCLFTVLYLLTCKVNAQASAQGLTFLQQIFASAVQHNPELLAERSKLGISQAEILTAGVIENPYLIFVTEPRKQAYRFQLQKTFIYPAVKKYERLIPKTEHEINLIQYRAKYLEIQDRIRYSYANLYANKNEYELYNEVFCMMNNLLKEVQDKKLSKKDLLHVEIFMYKLRNEVEVSNDNYINSRLSLQELIGHNLPENTNMESPTNLPQTFELFNITNQSNIKKIMPETLIAYALIHNPKVLEKQQQIQLAKYEKDLAKANVFPLLTVAAGVDLDLQSGGTQTPRINVNLELPVLDREKGEIQRASVQINHYQMSEEVFRKQVANQIHAIYERIVRYQELISCYEDQRLPYIYQLVQASNSDFIECEIDISDVINVLKAYIDIQLSYFQTIKNFQDSVGDLEKLLGLIYK